MENAMIDIPMYIYAHANWVSKLYFYFLATNTLFGRNIFSIMSTRRFLDLATAATYSPYGEIEEVNTSKYNICLFLVFYGSIIYHYVFFPVKYINLYMLILDKNEHLKLQFE